MGAGYTCKLLLLIFAKLLFATILSIGYNQVMVDTLITVFLLAWTFLIISIFSEVLFLEERVSGSYETLLTTPLSIRKIITGKALASFIFSYVMVILSVVGMLISLYFYKSFFLLPSIFSFISAFIVIPIFSFSFVRLFGTLLFSTRNIQNIYIFRYIFIFGTAFGLTKIIPIILKYTSPEYLLVGINVTLLLISAILIFITNILISKISTEDIFMNCK